jgi:hypothetical protein
MLRVTTGLAFVGDHPTLNFVHTVIGVPWFTDDLFVLLVGLTEATLGALLISGRLPRLVVLGMWAPFHLGIPLLASQELIGHLPICGVMYLLLVCEPALPGRAERRQPLRQTIPLKQPQARLIPSPGNRWLSRRPTRTSCPPSTGQLAW